MTPGALGLGVGAELRCIGWRQEGILRMLENTLANAERPDELIVYGGTGKAARDIPSLRAIVKSLRDLGNDETLLVQSGRPVAVFRTYPESPRVLIANANLVPRAASPKHFFDLSDAGLTMHGQYTAGCWAYIGGQGILQGTFETFAACATQAFGSSLVGRIVFTAGVGGMGRAQGPAIAMNGGVALICDVDEAKLRRRVEEGYLDVMTSSLDDAWKRCRDAAGTGTALMVGLTGNAADVAKQLCDSGRLPDVATDQTAAHDLVRGYIPSDLTVEEASALRNRDPADYRGRAVATLRRHIEALLTMRRCGVVVFEYGNDLRQSAAAAGVPDTAEIPGFVPSYIRPSFAVGRGPFRWVCLSGEVDDRKRLDAAAKSLFPDDHRLQTWLALAEKWTRVEGLPARVCWLGHGDRQRMAQEINRLVRDGELRAPVAITRDHLDSGSCAYPARETEAMPDGSDEIADWVYLNAMMNAVCGADLVAVHQNAGDIGGSASAGMTVICDGTDLADERIDRCFDADPGIGVVRHASAGVPEATQYLPQSGIRVPTIDEDAI